MSSTSQRGRPTPGTKSGVEGSAETRQRVQLNQFGATTAMYSVMQSHAEIAEARAHPSVDNLQIVELKRRKLLVKDEIARLQSDISIH